MTASKRVWTFAGIGLLCGVLSAQLVMLLTKDVAPVILVLLHGLMMMALLLTHLLAQPERHGLPIVLASLWPGVEIVACLFAGLAMSLLVGFVTSIQDTSVISMTPLPLRLVLVATLGALTGGAVLALAAWFILRTRRVWILVLAAGLAVCLLFLTEEPQKLAQAWLPPLLSEWLLVTLFCALTFSLFAAALAWCLSPPNSLSHRKFQHDTTQ